MKKIQAWAWFTNAGTSIRGLHYSTKEEAYRNAPFMSMSMGHRLVRLVPHNEAAARALRAAVACCNGTTPGERKRLMIKLHQAMATYEESLK